MAAHTDKVIESESTIVLTRRESLRLLELIENPPPMNAKLKKLMADYEKERADDRERKAPADAARISSVKVPNATTLKAIAEPKPPHP